jgi:aspartate aminotransferase
MTGWRLGYMGAPQWIADACDKIQGQFTSATCSITQRAAIAALQAEPSVTDEMRKAFQQRRDFVVQELKKIERWKVNMPEGAFYVFPDVSNCFGRSAAGQTIQNADDLCMYLLDAAEVSTVPGDAFGSPDYIRISYATSLNELEKACRRIQQAIAKLK